MQWLKHLLLKNVKKILCTYFLKVKLICIKKTKLSNLLKFYCKKANKTI